jgi:hypothetical protein
LVNNEHNNKQMMGAISSGDERWLLTAVLAYGSKVTVVIVMSGSG